ncbi:MAG: class I SAM-dependent methyltransferase [Betaproteobacteria bacterium]|nr:class I SAM-dependent methyltransferase [Betaproteobacteria bacterium]
MLQATVNAAKWVSRSIGLTPIIKRWLYPAPTSSLPAETGPLPNAAPKSYEARLLAEQQHFADQSEVHDLPEIFHYWSNKYLRPKLEQFGFSDPDQFFVKYLEQTFAGDRIEQRKFISIGAGNCDTEVRLAKILIKAGWQNFTLECLDINADMLARGDALAQAEKLQHHVVTRRLDFNQWQANREYDAVIANQSLHHVVELEKLFDAIAAALKENGLFITSDMIGRNGHQRWPEALEIVHDFWQQLPEKYHYNHQLKRIENPMENWDCSGEGFEGIRSQDILPLLLQRFQFDLFIGYANVIDPFIDRSFGPNFDIGNPDDVAFIDRIHERDEVAIAAGAITPTHMMAVMSHPIRGSCCKHAGLSPENSVRKPD